MQNKTELKNSIDVRVQERTSNLEKINRELKRLNKGKSNFISMVFHDLQTPLTSIKSFAEILLDDIGDMDIELQKKYLSIINEESEKLSCLISSVFDLQNTGAGKILQKKKG